MLRSPYTCQAFAYVRHTRFRPATAYILRIIHLCGKKIRPDLSKTISPARAATYTQLADAARCSCIGMADSARSTGRDKNARPRERIFIHLRAYSSAASGKKGKGKACAGISIRDVAAQKSLSSLYAARFRERERKRLKSV